MRHGIFISTSRVSCSNRLNSFWYNGFGIVWLASIGEKNKNGKMYVVGPFASNYLKCDRILFTKISDEEGSSRPPILTFEMVETLKHLVLSKAPREAVARGWNGRKEKKNNLGSLP